MKYCTNPNDCSRPDYSCKRDPVCRVNGDIKCSETDKVCVDYNAADRCNKDSDCSYYDNCDGYQCLTGNLGIGYCVKYEEP